MIKTLGVMDKLLEMEEQLKRNVGAMDEEGQAKFVEACEYIKEHGHLRYANAC